MVSKAEFKFLVLFAKDAREPRDPPLISSAVLETSTIMIFDYQQFQ
jgi:hypothetical protein